MNLCYLKLFIFIYNFVNKQVFMLIKVKNESFIKDKI